MKGKAFACGSATVINAIALGKGAAFAIDLGVEAEVELWEGGEIVGEVGDTDEDSSLIEFCVEKVLDRFNVLDKYGGKVRTTSDLPMAVGLSSSSAAANASVLATCDALGRELEDGEALDIGIEAAFDAGTTITGAFDDASASYFGGGTVTDNEERELLDSFEVDSDLEVLILVPEDRSYTVDVDEDEVGLIEEQVRLAFDEVISGNVFGALTLNGLLYSSVLGFDVSPALDALENEALAAGLTGTGPAVVAVCEGDDVKAICDCWSNYNGDVLRTEPSLEGAVVR